MSYEEILDNTRQSMEKALKHLQEVLRSIRTGRATPALVEGIRVEYYGTPTPISQLASISIPEARTIAIKPFDGSVLGDLQKALLKSDLGVSPQNDGRVVRLNLPPLSGEQRTKFAAKVKELCEESRVAMRNSRRDQNKAADQLSRSGEITEDDNRRLHGEIQDLLKEYEKKIDEVNERKTAEIMEV